MDMLKSLQRFMMKKNYMLDIVDDYVKQDLNIVEDDIGSDDVYVKSNSIKDPHRQSEYSSERNNNHKSVK